MASYIDVFLSHSGTQKNFIRQLHRDLTREHVSCFFDEDRTSLPLTEEFPSLMLKAAETCKIAVVLLSKEFIHSKWPMIELWAFDKAKKSGKNANLRLLPIFFKIQPNELSDLLKDNQEWQKFKESDERRCEWQKALDAVRPIHGLTFRENGNEVDLRDQVVETIHSILRGIKPYKLLEFKPAGIEEQVLEVEKALDINGPESVLAVIVYGFGGVGKSTLAASVIQSLDWSSTDFKFCKVVIDQKTADRTRHIIKLQKHILSDLGAPKVGFHDTLDGKLKIKEALENKSCLLFIDNVVDKVYIKDLLPQDFLFSPEHKTPEQKTKLRILITSRENNLKPELKIICKEYEVKCLSNAVSRSLLLKTIVADKEVEHKDFDETSMIKRVADACRGVPLLLSVIGKHLRVERKKASYEEALDALREGNLDSYRDEDLGAKLMFVYNKIKDVEVKEAFLDICTYFHGWEWNLVIDIVDFRQLNDLHRRALVSKSSSDEVIVHDILRFMGMKEASLTRFSNLDNLDGFENVKDVKGISVVEDKHLITIQSIQLEAMSESLRVLMLGDWVTLEGALCQKAFPNLRYLYVGDITTFPFKDPSKLKKLKVLLNRSKPGMNLSHLPSSLRSILHEVPHVECDKFVKLPFQNLNFLKTFRVKTSKRVELPEELHLPSSLVDLDLNRCKNLPKDMDQLTALESLILDRSDLEYLPQGFDKLQKLKHLSLNYCSKLALLCEELGMLSSLEALSMKGCKNLRALPESLGRLLSLQTLEFDKCINLHGLPESLGELCIESLNLHSLDNLMELPNSFGMMPFLKNLSLKSCDSLMSLPKSFVQLKLLETLEIIQCANLSVLPEDFGLLRCLKRMTVSGCELLKELPHGFGALPALKTFTLGWCSSFVKLSEGFTKLANLEELSLCGLPLSTIPDGFGKLKKLRFLDVEFCAQLKTLSDDFENMATLERLRIRGCSELDGAIMEKIVKLPNCYMADIGGSRKLLEKWEHMQGEKEHPILVFSGEKERDVGRAVSVAVLNGKCMEVKNGELMERSSLLVGLALEEGTTATVALIMLPVHMQPHHHQTLQRLVKMARERAESKLQIVCARKVELHAERPWTATEEREGGIGEIVGWLPLGSCVIPSSQSKHVNILTSCCQQYSSWPEEFSLLLANVGVDMKFSMWDNISVNEPAPRIEMGMAENEHYNSIQSFIKSVCHSDIDGQCESESVAGESKTGEFREALKGNGIHYLLTDNNKSQVMVDDLHGKTIGFIICNFIVLELMKLQRVYKHVQEKDSNFIWIWIPVEWPEDCGHGSYTRLIQCMPWAFFPHPQLVNVEDEEEYPCFVVVDKEGQIANKDALPLLLGWGVESYPFTRHTIPECFSLVESESCLEFLLHGMKIDGRKPMTKKITFLHVAHPDKLLTTMKCRLEQLTQMHGSFEVLYVGRLFEWGRSYETGIGNLKEAYEDATQKMRWPSLSFSDMIMFWYRCKYLASEKMYQLYRESNMMMEPLHELARSVVQFDDELVLVDNDGHVVTNHGDRVVNMVCESSDGEDELVESSDGKDEWREWLERLERLEWLEKEWRKENELVKDELLLSLRTGECTPLVKTHLRW